MADGVARAPAAHEKANRFSAAAGEEGLALATTRLAMGLMNPRPRPHPNRHSGIHGLSISAAPAKPSANRVSPAASSVIRACRAPSQPDAIAPQKPPINSHASTVPASASLRDQVRDSTGRIGPSMVAPAPA